MENTIVVGNQDPVLKPVNTAGVGQLMSAYTNSAYPNSGYYQPQMQTKPNYNPTVGNGGNTTTYPTYVPENTQNNVVTTPNYGIAGPLGSTGQNMTNNNGMGTLGSALLSGLSGLLGGYGGQGSHLGYGGYGGYSGYITQMYDAALNAQLEALKSAYEMNVSNLDASRVEMDDTYREEKRQAVGNSARDAAAWRELANAYGLNSGAIGQAALAQNNQIQSNLNTLATAQAAALAEIERQRLLLGKEYQSQINQAVAENNFEKANALYQEAVRLEEKMDELRKSGGSSRSYSSGSGSSPKTTGTSGGSTTNDPKKQSGTDGVDSSDETHLVTQEDAADVLKQRLAENSATAENSTAVIERYLANGIISEEDANTLLDEYEKKKAESRTRPYGLTEYLK